MTKNSQLKRTNKFKTDLLNLKLTNTNSFKTFDQFLAKRKDEIRKHFEGEGGQEKTYAEDSRNQYYDDFDERSQSFTNSLKRTVKSRCNDAQKRVFEFKHTQLAQLKHNQMRDKSLPKFFINNIGKKVNLKENRKKPQFREMRSKTRSIEHFSLNKAKNQKRFKRTPDINAKNRLSYKKDQINANVQVPFTEPKNTNKFASSIPRKGSFPTQIAEFSKNSKISEKFETPLSPDKNFKADKIMKNENIKTLKSLPAVPATTSKKKQESIKNKKKYEKLIKFSFNKELKDLTDGVDYTQNGNGKSKSKLKKSVQFQLP